MTEQQKRPARRVVPITERVRTRSGIEIGSGYVPPPAPMSEDAATIQLALHKRRRGYVLGAGGAMRRLTERELDSSIAGNRASYDDAIASMGRRSRLSASPIARLVRWARGLLLRLRGPL